ncbi:MAG: VWA domain-containing protein [Actinobacteria bacterium]|nr:MAG: VWA domain-containing protein [Actinomycetota bacterium]
MSFLEPKGALLALVVAIPIAAFVIGDRRRAAVTRSLRITALPRSVRLSPAVALVVAGASLSLAATQPTLVRRSQHHVRKDAQAWFVLDTSLSMKAAAAPAAPTRFERAQALAIRLRRKLGDVPVGIASITDRALPHLFPTADLNSFVGTIRHVIGIERPPPSDGFGVRITQLGAIGRIASDNFFAPTARKRLLVVFTDGETKPFADASLPGVFHKPPAVHAVFVRIWGADERVWNGRQADPLYRPDPASAENMQALANASRGVAVDGADFNGAVAAARRALGSGPTAVVSQEQRRFQLAPYFAGLAFLPIGFLLFRRNL